MEIFDQGHLHALLEQPETNISQPGIEPGLAYAIAIWNLYVAAPVHVAITHGLQ